MSRLRIFDETAPEAPLLATSDLAAIAGELAKIGVAFEQWEAAQPIQPGDAPETILAAYKADIDRLVDANGFKTVDVVSIAPDNPQKEAMRAKFLSEHTHTEDEVRFFHAGTGNFVLHLNGKVFDAHCAAGDLISVPANSRHWFDAGENPSFAVVRVFTETAGWTPHYTGTDMAERFPAATS